MPAADARWVEEATRLYRRYEHELVEAHDLCPWAARVRRDGRLLEQVMLQRDDVDIEPSLAVIDAMPDETDLALFIYPRFAEPRQSFERFAARVRDASAARSAPRPATFFFVVFHPEAHANVEEPERLVPFLRRTPDATIQVVRSAVLDRVRAGTSEGTQFVDAKALETWSPQPPTIRERIAQANLATVLRVGLVAMGGQMDDIIRDRQETYRRLEAEPSP